MANDSLAADLRQLRYHAGAFETSERRGASITGAWGTNHPKYRLAVERLTKYEVPVPLSRGLISYIEKHRPELVRNVVWSIQLAPVDRMNEWVYRWNDWQRWWVLNRTNRRANTIERDWIIDKATSLDEWDAYWRLGGEPFLRDVYAEQNKQVMASLVNFGKAAATGNPIEAVGAVTKTFQAAPLQRQEAQDKATVNQQLKNRVERTIRALIKIESNGRADAVSPSGKHFGILQIGEATASDVGYTARDALNPQVALRIFMLSMQRSASTHRWIPILMAFRWKAGNGTLKEFLAKAEVMGPAKALQTVASTGSSWRSAIPEYLRRFNRAYQELK